MEAFKQTQTAMLRAIVLVTDCKVNSVLEHHLVQALTPTGLRHQISQVLAEVKANWVGDYEVECKEL
jgi:GTP cyclohydrolase I